VVLESSGPIIETLGVILVLCNYSQILYFLTLPHYLGGYLLTVFEKMAPEKRRPIIYDQHNPASSKYYANLKPKD